MEAKIELQKKTYQNLKEYVLKGLSVKIENHRRQFLIKINIKGVAERKQKLSIFASEFLVH